MPHPLITVHAEALARLLGQPAYVIATTGLSAHDFSGTLTFRFQDGSHATFHYALFVHAAEAREIAVFTEHCGYFVFPDYVEVWREGVKVFDGLAE